MATKTAKQNEAGKSRTQITLENKQRAQKALQLRTMRVSWESIAKQCNYASRGAAYNAVQRELQRIPREAAKELRTAELEALDVAQRAIANRIARGDFAAIDRMLRIMDTRAKLTGLYENIVDTGVDEVKGVLQAWLADVEKEVDSEDAELAEGEQEGDA